MNTDTIHLHVNMPEQSPNFSTITDALEWLGDASTEKCYPAPTSTFPRAILHIGAGVYREKLVVNRPNVTFWGEGAKPEDVVLVYGDGAVDDMPDGSKRGTFRTASVRIDAADFTAQNITFQNDAGPGSVAGQALALYVDGDRAYFENCRMLGHQDTIFTAPLPEQEFQAGGFKGPGEFKPRTMTRQYYKNCYIEGDVDFIFGSALCYFDACTIFSKSRGEETSIHGYLTAASTPQSAAYGYVFKDCKLDSDCPPASVYLGRPWREYAKTVFLNCELGAHIHPLGWNDWKKTHGNFYYGEYNSYGPGANPEARADFSHQLTEEDAAQYTIENVLNGWNPTET